jgi:hypothetical protein
MYIKQIVIENIRGFEKVDLDLTRPDGSFAGWTVVAGVNGSGKTTFLRALALSVAAVPTALALVESYEGWVRVGMKLGTAHALLVRTAGDYFHPSSTQKRSRTFGASFWTGLRWNAGRDSSVLPLIEMNKGQARAAPQEGPCADRPEGWFIAGYGPFRRISGGTPAGERLMRGPSRVARLASLFREDVSLVESVSWLQAKDYRSKEEGPDAARADALKNDVLALLGDSLFPPGIHVDRVDSHGLWMIRDGVSLPHTQLSDGYKAVTALVLDIVRHLEDTFGPLRLKDDHGVPRVMQRGVVLIDEIDAHLHPSWQKRIGFWLKEHFPNIQFIVTTHSPFVCQAADQGGLIRLPSPGSGEPVAAVDDRIYNLVVNGTADDAVMSELFGRERPYSQAAAELRDDISRLGARITEGKATPKEEAEYKAKKQKLPTTPSAQVERALLELTARLGPKKGARR